MIKTKHISDRQILLFFLILGIIVYSQSFFAALVWDDLGLVANNPLIKEFHLLPYIFTSGLFLTVIGDNFYRPVQSLSLFLDNLVWGNHFAGMHLTNILLHVFCAFLLYYLFTLIFNRRLIAFLAACIFLVHPINVEAVSYISGRADSLVLLNLILSFLFYFKFRVKPRPRLLIFSTLFFGLALLSKELALGGLLLFVLIDYALDKKINFNNYLAFLALSLIYLFIRFFVLGITSGVGTFGILPRLWTFAYYLFDYIRLIFWPVNQHMSYTSVVFNSFSFIVLGRLIIVVFFFILLKLALKEERKVFYFCFFWFFIFLFSQSGIFPINAYFAEHFIYLSQYPLFFMILLGLFKLLKGRGRDYLYLGLFSAIIMLSFATLSYSMFWSDPIKFYLRIIKLSPGSFAAYNNLGAELEAKGLNQEAEKFYWRAYQLNSRDGLALNNLGKLYLKKGRVSSAIGLFKQGIKKEPNQSALYYNLGKAYGVAGNLEASISEFEKAFALAKKAAFWDYSLYSELGLLYRQAGKNDLAITEFKKAIYWQPSNPALHLNLGLVYKDQANFNLAVEEYSKALKLNPQMPEAYNNLAIVYALTGNPPEAIKNFSKAIKLNNNYYEAKFNLGLLYIKMNELKAAREQLLTIPQSVSFYPLLRKQLETIKNH